jgi:hypothetical protein
MSGTDPDEPPDGGDSSDRSKFTRREVVATLAATGAFASLGAGQSGGGSGGGTVLGIGGGSMADAIGELRVKTYVGTMAERPSAGVEGRVFKVWDPSDSANHGAIFYDDGTAWEVPTIGSSAQPVPSVTTEHVGNVTLASAYDTLQDAIDNAEENWVFVDGRFEVDPPLNVPPGMTLLGSPHPNNSIDQQYRTGSKIFPSGDATNLIVIQGGGAGAPHETELIGLFIDDNNQNIDNLVDIESNARSTRYERLLMYGGEYAFRINGAGVKIDKCEMNEQQSYGIKLNDNELRDVTVENSNFEGFTHGHCRTFNALDYSGAVRFKNCRFSYYDVPSGGTGDFGFNLRLGSAAREFSFTIENSYFFEFQNPLTAIYVDGSDIPGPIKVKNNTFVGNNRDDDTATGGKAIEVTGEVSDSIEFVGNSIQYFTAGAKADLSATKNTLTAYGNTGQSLFENRGNASVSDGDTIAHGLEETPEFVNLTAAADGHIAVATAIDGTNITVGLHDDGGNAVTSDETVYWEARYV